MYLILLHVLFTGVCLVSSCPEGCRCLISEVLCRDTSSGTLLTRIPELPADTLELDVYGQNIERIYKQDFTGEIVPCLERLYLENDNIRLVDDGAFEELEGLTFLSLSENLISAINESTFSNLQRLQEFFLGENDIEVIADGAFKDLGNLLYLDLTGNSISAVNEFTFRGLRRLLFLGLQRNNIADIDAAAFKGLRNLRVLSLSENNITVVPDGAFSKLRNLNIRLVNNSLLCDCRMRWIIDYISEGLKVDGTCQFPANLEGTEISSLSDENMADCQFTTTTDTPIVTRMTTDERLSTAQNSSSSRSLMEKSPLINSVQPTPSVSPEQPTLPPSTFDHTSKQPTSSFSSEKSTISPSTLDTSRDISFPQGTYYMGLITAFLFGGAVVAMFITLCLFLKGI